MSSGSNVPAKPVTPPPAAHESVLQKIEGWFHHVEKTAEQEFLDAWHYFEPAAKQLLETELGGIARVAVTNAEALLTNEEKASAALAAILAAAEKSGITVAESLATLLRELAVQELKGTLAGSSAPAKS